MCGNVALWCLLLVLVLTFSRTSGGKCMRKCCPVVFSSSADFLQDKWRKILIALQHVVFSSSADFLQDKWRKVYAEMLPCGVFF